MAHASMGRERANVNIRNGATSRKRSTPQLSRTAVLARGRRAEIGIARVGRFKRRCGWSYRQQTWSAQARFRLVWPAQSPPISRSAEWPRACARGTALRCNSASTARCGGAQENARSGDLPSRAISARPPRVHARIAVPTWRGRIGSRFTMWDRVGSTRKQRLTAHCYPLSRDYAPNHRPYHSPLPRQARRLSLQRGSGFGAGQSARGMHAPKTDPPGRGNPGGSR